MNLIKFLVDNQFATAGALTLLLACIILSARGFSFLQTQTTQLAALDTQLVKAICAQKQLDTDQKLYVTMIGNQLRSYVIGGLNSTVYYQTLGVIIVVSPFVSAAVTGLAFIPCDVAKNTAFGLNILAAASLAVTQFFQYAKNSSGSTQLAAKLRLELLQYIGRSSEYADLGDTDRYKHLATSTDTLLEEAATNLNPINPLPPKKQGQPTKPDHTS